MADLVPSGIDQTTGQTRNPDQTDNLTDTSGNLVTKDSVRLLNSPTVTLSMGGNTTLYIVPTGKTVFVTEILVAVDTATDIDTPASVSVGTATSTDIVTERSLLGLTNVNRFYSLDVSSNAESATAGSNIVFYITAAATGAGSPSQTATVYLLGIEI